jgi:hypothetical protein
MLLMLVFGLFYLVFAIVFGVYLGKWDDKVPGRCFDSYALASPGAPHPTVDKVYLSITCLYMFVMLGLTLAIAISRREPDPAWGKRISALAGVLIDIGKSYVEYVNSILVLNFVPLESWANLSGLWSKSWYLFKTRDY